MKTNILVIFIFILLQISCNKFHDVYFNLDHSDWFKYKLGDTLIYKSENKVDTFTVFLLQNGSDITDKVYHHEYLNIICRKLYSQCNNCEDIEITRESDHVLLGTQDLRFFATTYYNDKNTFNYNFGDTLIENVYKLEDTINSLPTDITVMYYNNTYGVFRYDQKNGEYFELQLK
jgi:hypothetical protein